MRKTLAALSIIVALASSALLAQDATLTSPVARTSEAKYVLRSVNFNFGSSTASIEASVQDAGSADLRTVIFAVPDTAHPGGTFSAFLTAVGTVRATEAGTAVRKAHFRVLGFLSDNGYLPASTLNP